MKAACLLYFAAFAVKLYVKGAQTQDYISAVIAFFWLVYFRKINFWMIKHRLQSKKFNSPKNIVKIDHKSILCQLQANQPMHIEWKKLKYILRNKDGYIIPLTGISNAGKFMWLPYRCFANNNIEEEFLNIVSKCKLKIKNIAQKN